jgi:PAS domain S-box-containing protein
VPGNTFEQIVRLGAERGQYAQALGRVDDWVRERVAQHQLANGEMIEQQLDDGRWLQIVEYRTPSGYIVGNRIDITERKRMQQALAVSEQRWELAVSAANDGVWDWNLQTDEVYFSPRWKGMLGYGVDEIGATAYEWRSRLHPDEAAQVESEVQRHLSGETEYFQSEQRMRCRDGEYKWILARGRVLLDTQGRRLRMLGSHSDVTQRVLEVGLRVSQTQGVSRILYLRDITHESEVDRLKSEFLSTAAHELRTPMASIYGFAEVLLHQSLDEASRHEFLTIIFRQSEWMASILTELLDLARIEARRGKDWNFQATSLQGLVEEVRGCKPPQGCPAPVLDLQATSFIIRADEKKVQQAIFNVLSNAYKYSPQGSVVRVCIFSEGAGDRALASASSGIGVRISDQGIGMTAEQVRHGCERFYRADSSGRVEGTGLGMSIVKEIVDLHQGVVRIDSQPAQGSSVTLLFPAMVQSA